MWASMNHESYVLLVDAHTEGCSGDNNIVPWSIGNPFVLALCPLRSAQACVIRCCANVHPSNDHGVYHHGSGGMIMILVMTITMMVMVVVVVVVTVVTGDDGGSKMFTVR